MAVSVTHSTASDGTFSASGATAWDATHTVTGLATVATTGTYTDLTGTPTLGTAAAQNVGAFAQVANNLSDVTAATARTNLGLGTLATQSGTFSGTHSGASSGTNTGDQTIPVYQETPGGRLTLTSGLPVTTADVTGATSVYYTPYVSDRITLWDGAAWVTSTFTEQTLALGTITSALPYDVFGFISSSVLAIEKLAWTSATARATAITVQGGRYCKSGDKTRLYLGTFYTTSTTTTEDSSGGTTTQVGGKRFLWNMYNRVPRFMFMKDTGADWVYKTQTWRVANGATQPTCCNQFVIGLSEDEVNAQYLQTAALSVNTTRALVGVGVDSSTVPSGVQQGGYSGAAAAYTISALGAQYDGMPAVGYHYLAALEYGALGNDCQFSGGAVGQTGFYARVRA